MAFIINPTKVYEIMENRRLWQDALASGNYSQADSYLKTQEGYCCWGVLCDISGMGQWAKDQSDYYEDSYLIEAEGDNGPYKVPFDTHPPDELVIAVGFPPIREEGSAGAMLMVANDEGVPFSTIAKMIASAPVAGEGD